MDDEPFSVQIRDAHGELLYVPTLREAVLYSREHPDIQKISFALPTGERCRLVNVGLAPDGIPRLELRDLMDDVRAALREEGLEL